MWWKVRRPEIVEDYEREVYGRIPKHVPKVTWTVKVIDREFIFPGFIPVVAKQIVGHVDNSEYPLINVDIKMMLVVPMNVKGPVPVLMMFGQPSFPAPAQPSNDDMETLNATFKDMMIKTNPEVKNIFDKYPAYSPITKTILTFSHRLRRRCRRQQNNCLQRAGVIALLIQRASRPIMVMD